MDEKELLAEILKSSQQTNDLLRKHLFRLRFSLLSILVVMTLVCVFLGIAIYGARPKWSPAATQTVLTTPQVSVQIRELPTDPLFGGEEPQPTPRGTAPELK
jgi:hypothetical protein